jgi:hypothetical protein
MSRTPKPRARPAAPRSKRRAVDLAVCPRTILHTNTHSVFGEDRATELLELLSTFSPPIARKRPSFTKEETQ